MSAWARLRHSLTGHKDPEPESSSEPGEDSPAPIQGHLAVVVEGFRGERLDSILETIAETAAKQRMTPVIITTLGDLPFLRHVSLPLEAIWDIQPGRRDHGILSIRQTQQLEAIVRLWQPFDVAAFTSPQGRYIGDLLRETIKRLRERS